MNQQEFCEYMKENLSAFKIFHKEALKYQKKVHEKWNEKRQQEEVELMWVKTMTPLFEQIERDRKKKSIEKFMKDNDILELVNEGMNDIEFEVYE